MNTVAPTAADIENLAMQAFDALPYLLRTEAGEIVFRVEEFPDEEIIRSMELESGFELLGLYQGIDILNKGVSDASPAGRGYDLSLSTSFARLLVGDWRDNGTSCAARSDP